ncbi:Protein CBG05632 [Caenorhabditis briggsae]|uniref:Protein CBG05632 n=1 Tax=Caenorhabditis briggsae TaxID=6238 RepID=A8X0B1_CAEBR|nr:Protein CBG05632 [Caenorhabditis briggsae]CAP26071.2 Protein CBG05632 [Caenorhabditis briggsae]
MIVNFLNPEGSPLDIRYGAERGKTVVVKNAISKTRKEKVFENENFVDMFCNDFSILQRFISHQKVPMDEVSFKIFREDHAGTFAKIGSMLSKGKPLTTRKIALKVYRVEEIMAIFPYVAPGVLKDNYFEQSRMGITRNSHQLNLTDVAKLEQWKKADTVEIKDFTAFLKDDTPEFFEISAEAPEEHLYFEHVMKKMGGDWTEERNRDQLRRFRQVTPVGNKDKVATFLLFYSSLKLERNCLSED